MQRSLHKLSFLVPFLALVLAASACGRTPLGPPGGDGGIEPPVDGGVCVSAADCDDGEFCNGAEECRAGTCIRSMPMVCDDGDSCTVDACDESRDACTATALPRDRDGDGFLSVECGGDDCDDTRPDVNPSVRELCDNGIDDDCNFQTDCADAACSFAPFCMCEPRPEDCLNGFDDDCDGDTDCDDRDCARFPECVCEPRPEDCRNGIDDDCDGLIDCASPVCRMEPFCFCDDPRPEQCDNGEDDDCNFLVDCADPACADAPGCCVARMESCNNGLDDDCDGATDCFDMDCAGTPFCASCPQEDLGRRTGDSVASGSTRGRVDSQQASCAGRAASPDVTFSWTAPATGEWTFDTLGSDYDTALHIRQLSCSGPEIGCDDDGGMGLTSQITLRLMAGEAIIIIVDGFGGGSSGSYVLNITSAIPEAGNCDDGIDNDRDGQTDCADFDCRTDPVCMRPCPEIELGPVVGTAVATGSTVGQSNDLTPSCTRSFAPDVAFGWTAPRSARYTFDTNGSNFDTVLYLLDGSCGGSELRCSDDISAANTASRVTRTLSAGTRVVIVVDGDRAASGNYQLNITAREAGFCSDGIDNDADGSTDCADSECTGRPECCVPVPELCSDGRDQDCDGLVDCADPNCAGSASCCRPTVEQCANGSDEDCDGLIDCVDPDCRLDPVC